MERGTMLMDLVRGAPTWVEVDLDLIQHNVSELCRLAPGAQFMAVVKANGYGHGATAVAQAALAGGATWLGVTSVEEGVELRQAGITAPVLLLGYVPVAMADSVVLYELTPTVFHLDLARVLSRWSRALSKTTAVHVKVDTGMGRLGVHPGDLVEFAREVAALPNIEIEGLFTHLATASECDHHFVELQLNVFERSWDALKAVGIHPLICHACNSAGIMLYPRGHYHLVRGGIAIYGLPPNDAAEWPADLRPALVWKTRVSMLKTVPAGTPISYGCTYRTSTTERIATLPIGYADGYSRRLSNGGSVLIQGGRCPVVGQVCMNQVMVQIPDELDVKLDDEVVLLGSQGAEQVTASDIALHVGTINYEIICSIDRRIPRLYKKDGKLQK